MIFLYEETFFRLYGQHILFNLPCYPYNINCANFRYLYAWIRNSLNHFSSINPAKFLNLSLYFVLSSFLILIFHGNYHNFFRIKLSFQIFFLLLPPSLLIIVSIALRFFDIFCKFYLVGSLV